MKVIVFGGSGFLGSHVADALSNQGYEVSIYDIHASKYIRPDQTMIVGDILDEEQVNDAVKGCEIVYNFAGIADLSHASQRPMDSVKYNILGNTIVLEACRKNNVKRFVFASSMYVYSRNGSFYRSTKQASELIIENYHEVYGLDYTILRYGSLYGPRADENNFIRRSITQALETGKIVRKGDGEELREYIHIYDAAKGSVEILSDEFINEYVILTGVQQMKVKDFLLMIKEILNNDIELNFKADESNQFHYEMTPYSFAPKIAKKLVSHNYVDLGQGVLDLIHEIYSEINPNPRYDDWITQKDK